MASGVVFPPALAHIAHQRSWIAWRWGRPRGAKDPSKLTKIPCDAGGRAISSADPANLRTYGDLLDAVIHRVVDGVALASIGNDGSRLILDLDKCRDPATGALTEAAGGILDACGSYAEISPSGTGLRIIGGSEGWDPGETQRRWEAAGMRGETFFSTGFATITFNAVEGHAGLWAPIGGLAAGLPRRRGRTGAAIDDRDRAGVGADPLAPVEVIRETLALIPNPAAGEEGEGDWERWNAVGMRVFRACAGVDEGLEAWLEWSVRYDGYGGTDTCEARWEHWSRSSPPLHGGYGTLHWMAREAEREAGRSGWSGGPAWKAWRGGGLGAAWVGEGLGPLPCEVITADAVTEPGNPGYWTSIIAAGGTPPPRTTALALRPPAPDPTLFQPPIIRIFPGLRHKAADAGLAALGAAGVPFYQRDRLMVRVVVVSAKAADGSVVTVPSIAPVTLPILSRALGAVAEWETLAANGTPSRKDPPKEVAEQAAAMVGEWPFPPLAGVIGTQTMRPDGSLLTEPGYDEATGLVLAAPPRLPPIPSTPTRGDAEGALATLNTLLAEFPFADTTARSAAMSMILSAVLRGALPPAVPMHVVQAPQSGTGKSYLADIASMISVGERCAVIAVSPDPKETEARLIGAAIAGYPIIALDNCNGALTGDFLAQVTERPILQIRPLGTSAIVRVANTFTVFANGNNIAVAADLVRRTVLCTLDADMENPEARTFTADPLAMIAADRGKYIAAALTIGRAYICAGSPGQLTPTPSFERWSNLVRSALVWLGWEDPAASAEAIRAEDPVRSARAAVFGTWAAALSIGVSYPISEIIDAAERYNPSGGGGYLHPEFRSALLVIARAKTADRIEPDRLSKWLFSAAKVVSGKYKLLADRTRGARIRWSLEDITNRPTP